MGPDLSMSMRRDRMRTHLVNIDHDRTGTAIIRHRSGLKSSFGGQIVFFGLLLPP
jgi:hypothetical protein